MSMQYSAEIRARAREMWVRGEQTISGVARLLGVDRTTVTRWRDEDRWDEIKNQAQQEANRQEIEGLAAERSKITKNALHLFAFLQSDIYLRAKEMSELGVRVPLDHAKLMMQIVRGCLEGQYLALGIDPKLEAKLTMDSAPRRVMIEYDPLCETLKAEMFVGANGNGDGLHEPEDQE